MVGGELLPCGPSLVLNVVFVPGPAESVLLRRRRAPENMSFGASRLGQKSMGSLNSSSDIWLPGFNYTSESQCLTTSTA